MREYQVMRYFFYCIDLFGWRLKYEQSNFRMANISNLKINERWNVVRLNLRVTTIENKNSEDKASKFILNVR